MKAGRHQVSAKIAILLAAASIVALPFIFRRHETVAAGDALSLIIVTPHNEAIRYEFGHAFSKWHQQHYGRPVNVDWRAIGGTTEISRYLVSEYLNASRAWWKKSGEDWPQAANEILSDGKFAATNNDAMSRLWRRFRETDDARQFSAKVDLFFGGGEYDHTRAFAQGLTVPPWPKGSEPTNIFFASDGTPLIPEKISGETWRTPTLFGSVVSTFGICFNLDRLRDLAVTNPPVAWDDLADPRLFRSVGVSDPTKSGSIAKAFELIVHQKCAQAVAAAGYGESQIENFETEIAKANLPAGRMPPGVPPEYQRAIEQGWRNGLALLQHIGANARYFTDSASKVPVDVGMGACAAGLSIDFYARFEAQSTSAGGHERMAFVVPAGGSSATCDPVSLLRGAEHREVAVHFIEFLLGEDGQKIWCYKPGTPGGPEKYSLRRIPIRRDFFPSENPAIHARHLEHMQFAADDLANPAINPYAVADKFHYHVRWTGRHFGVLRDIVRAMCIDSAEELQSAWPLASQNPRLLAELQKLPDNPEPLTWTSALAAGKKYDRMALIQDWTSFFRGNYRAVMADAKKLPITGKVDPQNFQSLEVAETRGGNDAK